MGEERREGLPSYLNEAAMAQRKSNTQEKTVYYYSLQEGRSQAPVLQIPAHLGACGELTGKCVLNPTLNKSKNKLTTPGFTFTAYSSEENPEKVMA